MPGKAATQPHGPVVFVHGIWMTGLEMFAMRRRVRRAGFATRRFRYFSLWRDLADNAARLHAFIARAAPTTVHLVGHSLGGLVILELLRRFPETPPGRVVLLGSPVRGSQVARSLEHSRAGRLLLGRAGPGVLAARHEAAWDGSRPVGVIAGTRGVGIGRLFSRLPAPHDGTVAVAETKLPGADDTLLLPVTHTGLVYSRAVSEAVVRFLQHGRFHV